MNTEQQYTTEQLNDMITACNEVIHEARQANETAAAVLEFDKTENEGLIISANSQGQMMGFYIFRSVPIIRKVTDSPREMAESCSRLSDSFTNCTVVWKILSHCLLKLQLT